MLELEDFVFDYLKSNVYNYAILIDGDWGSGKTHYIKNNIIPKLECMEEIKFIPVYVSLFGEMNYSKIEQALISVKLKIYQTMIAESKKTRLADKYKSVIYKITHNKILLPFKNKEINNLPITIGIINDFIEESILKKMNEKQFLYIFDDLERNTGDLSDVLGSINYYITERNSKVIIIANQKEILKNEKESEILKELNFTLNDINRTIENLNIEEKHKESEQVNHNIKQYSFQEQKEKLIGSEYYYIPNIEEIISNIISKLDREYPNEETIVTIKKCKKRIIDLFEARSIYNFRTFLFAIEKYQTIYRKFHSYELYFCDFKYQISKEDIWSMLLLSVCNSSIDFKNRETSEISNSFVVDNENKDIVTFSQIYFYICYSEFSPDLLYSDMEKYFKYIDEVKDFASSEWNTISSWFEYSEKEVIDALNSIFKKIEKGSFSPNLFFDLYEKICIINCYSIISDDFFEKYFNKLSNFINRSNIEFPYEGSSFFSNNNEDLYKLYIKKIERFRALVKLHNKEVFIKTKKSDLLDPNWAINLSEDYTMHYEFRNRRKFLSLYDINKIGEYLSTASVINIRKFYFLMEKIYGKDSLKNSVFEKEISYIIELKENLLKIPPPKDKIRKMYFEWILMRINAYIQ